MTTTRKPRKAAAAHDPLAEQPHQRELAPAPAAPAANDEARAAIATINSQLAEFDAVEAGLADLERRYTGIAYDCTMKKGMDDACAARLEIRKPRFAVENARKAAKAPVLKLGRDIDARAGVITDRLLKIEGPIDDQIKVQERKEAERKAAIEQRLQEIRQTPQQCIGKTSAQLQEVLDALESLPLAEFDEFREQAAKAQFDAQQAVRTLLQQAQQAEELARLQEEQRREEARKAVLQQRVDAIADPLHLPYRSSERVQQAITRLEALVIGEDFQEFAPAAREKKAQVLEALTALRDSKAAAEQKAAEAAATPVPSPAPAKCDGNHAGPRCGDPECWQDDAPAGAPSRTEDAARATRAGDGLPSGAARIWGDEPIGRGEAGAPPSPAHAYGYVPLGAAPAAAPAPRPDVDEDPFSRPIQALAPSSELSIGAAQRPTDAEMLSIVADHYEVDAATAAAWLRTFDAAAALAQLALPI